MTQLCEQLGVTRNAINVQLRQLEAEGLVRRSKQRPKAALGKPAIVFEAAPGSEDVASSAYQAFLTALLTVLKGTVNSATLSLVLQEAGRHLARETGLSKPSSFDAGLQAAMAAANALGANTDVVSHPDGIMVRNFSCPIGSAVHREPCACQALAAFFSEATGCPATEHCIRDERLICQYLIKIKRRAGRT